ncbi:hypothetical protein [Geminisphaera colitermitum]|uniref:hypothetical protein n=1 Tax=Geminisphaera colitermitum TaxID=1148786 RepID=UPI000158D591|nr:hypothetical protein [Geminisphaera colitermitum]
MALHQSKIYRALGGDLKLLEKFCERMDAGDSARALANWVEEHAFNAKALPLTDQNITDFRQGWFARWQARRSTAAAIRERAAAARQLTREAAAGGASITEAAQLQAADMLTEVLETFDVGMLKAALIEKPGQFLQVVKTLAGLARSENERKALAQQAEKLAADLKLRDEQIATMRQTRDLVKSKLREQIDALKKAIAQKTGSAEGRQRMMQAVVDTIDSM